MTATSNFGSVTAVLTVTPGFLEPLTPVNAAVGAGGTLTITGYLAEVGGTENIEFALSDTATGSSGGAGTLGSTSCQHSASAFTSCTVTYKAPATVTSTDTTYVVAIAGASSSRESTRILLNTAGVASSPATHQAEFPTLVLLGSSGGNNMDYDTKGNQVVDCCSGTLGSLIQNSSGTQYVLSNNHVLARSDQASVGENIVQPGLIDHGCFPYPDQDASGNGGRTTPVGVLTEFLALSSSATNADAAIAQVNAGAVSSTGSIQELGAEQLDGALAAAPPGISSSGGKGESGSLGMTVAKSGRTTGLTCAAISAVNLDVQVSYYTNCAETHPYLNKTYKNQIAISGNQFSDAGDSGALVVDTSNAEPVGLLFAGGVDSSEVSQGVASPVTDVLSELGKQIGGGTPYTFVGAADHPVSCLNYGDSTWTATQERTLTGAEMARVEEALAQARMLLSPANGILGVAIGKSSDRAGEGAVILYLDQNMKVNVPATISGVRTVPIPTTAHAVAYGSAPQSNLETKPLRTLPAAVLNLAVSAKQQIARRLMNQNPAFFGVGVGQSLDNPREAALVIYVDRTQVPRELPAVIDGLRTHYVVMDRLHVTRSYAAPGPTRSHCLAHTGAIGSELHLMSHPMKLNLR